MQITIEVNIEKVENDEGDEIENRDPFYEGAEEEIRQAIEDVLIGLEVQADHPTGEHSYTLTLDCGTPWVVRYPDGSPLAPGDSLEDNPQGRGAKAMPNGHDCYGTLDRDECATERERSVAGVSDTIPTCRMHGDPHGTSPEKVEAMRQGTCPPVLLAVPDASYIIGTDPSCRAMTSYIFSEGPEPRAFLGSDHSHRASLRLVSPTGILPTEWQHPPA